MKPSKEDLVQREQAAKTAGKRSGVAAGSGSGPLTLVLVVLFIVLAAGGGAGWFMWQQLNDLTQRLDRSHSALTDSETELGSLKSQLETRNASLSKQKGVVAKDLSLLQSEVRKLWDVSNKRNKKNIKSNKDNLAALSKASKKHQSQLAKQVKSTSALSLNVSQLHEEITRREQSQDKLIAEIGGLTEQVASLQAENDMLKVTVVEQEKLLQGLKNGQLQRQITDLEQAIKAIDAHRSQVNGRLDRLDKELGALYSKK